MNTPLHHDPQQPDVFLGSTQTPPSRPLLASKDSKRVCFYKSGDPQFSGHWVVINSRTFKTFEALLDALSNKVPLPFGVRTITTPKGTHTIRSLDDLQHGASYVCSDQRKVKPMNLDEINRRHVPWNSPRPASAGGQGRRGLIWQLVKKNEVGRMAKRAENSVTVRTPKRLVVFRNRDPSTKRIVVLQRRTAPTFEALLEYLSQVMQFPVVKLYTAEGRRLMLAREIVTVGSVSPHKMMNDISVITLEYASESSQIIPDSSDLRVEGLPGLILCSGVIIAAGNEPFQMADFSLQESTQPLHSVISDSSGPKKTQPLQQVQQKSVSSRPRSRNFSLSSERYFVNQINMSLNGSRSEDNEVKAGSTVSANNRALESEEMDKCDFTSGTEEKDRLIIPSDDEIEKSFRVNQDGSMTVEMKVRLTIKQEETIHWTTTVSRASVNSQEMAPFSQPVSGYNSPDNKDNNRRETNIDGYESKNESTQTYKPVRFNDGERHSESVTSEAMEKPKPRFRRLPTPGPRRVRRKETSLENIKRLSETEVQESTVGAYSYVEHTTEGELFEGYCVVSHSSSSSTRPIPKPRKKDLTHCSHSGMAEVLQLHNKGKEITETVMHIHQSQDTCENYLAKTWAHEDYRFEFMCEHKKLDSTEPGSSSNDCNTDLTKLSTSSGSGNAKNNACSSLLSGQSDLSLTMSNNASSFTDNEIQARCEPSDKKVQRSINSVVGKKAKKGHKSETSNKHLFLKSAATDKKQKGSVQDLKNRNSPESQSFTESDKFNQKVKRTKKGQSPEKVKACHNDMLKDTSQNINPGHTDMLRPHMMDKLDIIPPSHSAPFTIPTKQRSANGSMTKSPKASKELSESVSMPVLYSSPCNVHQYVENWLENIHTESAPYMDELNPPESRARFQIKSDFSDISEIRSELDKDSSVENCASVEGPTVRKPVSQLIETQNMIRSCKSMPSTRILPAEREIGTRKNKSSEDLVPKLPGGEGETSPNTQLNPRSGMKDIMEQLCLSIQFIRRSCSHSNLSSLNKKKKFNSLPDVSSQLASVFGSPYKAFLSFLTVMTLRDGLDSSVNDDSGSNPEALQVMQSIQTLVSIEDEEELKTSLASLHSSTSARLKKSWRDFQEKNNTKESPPLSPRQSEQEFALEVNSEEDDQDNRRVFGIREVMDELNMCEDLRREISSLVRGAEEHSGHENKTIGIACENEDATMKDELGMFLEKERRYLEETESQHEDITNSKPADLIPVEDITNQKGPATYTPENVDEDVRTNQERYVCNEPSKADLCEEKQEMMDSDQITEEKYTEEIPIYSPTNLEDSVEWQENIGCVRSESELRSPTLEMEPKDARINSEVIENTASNPADCTDSLEGRGINSKEDDTYCETREHPKQDLKSSETETVEGHRLNNCTFRTEDKNETYKDARSEASSFSTDEADRHSNDENDKVVNDNNSENTLCNTSECKNQAKPHHSSVSDKEDALSDHYKSVSCTWQESETEPELQKLEESTIDKQAHDANESDEEADFDAKQNSPRQPCQDDGYSDHSESYKGQERAAVLDLQMLEEESVSKNPAHSVEEEDNDTDEHDDKQSNASDTDKALDTQSHCYSEDPSSKGILSRELCESEEKLKAQSEDSAGIEEGEVDHKCHCVHPTVFPQQLLDFLNLALKSSALIFTYDSNGRLRIEPNRCESRARCLSKSNVDNQYATRCLPSPNTSDLSDYRPDTSDSGGVLSQVSTDLLTEIAEDEAERLFIYQGFANLDRKVKTLDNGSKTPHPDTKPIVSPNSKSVNSFNSFADSMVNGTIQDPVYFNSSDSIGNSELGQCPVFHAKPDSGEGILIDKGRWLLKENHLIRKSPPVPMGMYGNVDTTSVDTGQEDISEDAPYIPCGRKQSPLAGISSSELEDMAKPPTPKCTYFNMAHSSDSDPFLDNQSITSNKGKGFTRKSNEVSPIEPSKMLAKKNGSLPSFASVEFKVAAGKVHPEDSMASSVVEKSAHGLRCNIPHEEDPAEGLSLRCGQHCPIL